MLSLVFAVLFSPTRDDSGETKIALQPYGNISRSSLNTARKGIERMFRASVEILPARPLPKAAYYSPRNRYRAEKLLVDLDALVPSSSSKIIGLTAQDISTNNGKIKDWGVLGLGQLGGKACVVSTFRMHAKRATETTFRFRLQNTVNHEIGHTFGLPHCPHVPCVMNDAKGTIKTADNQWNRFCSSCRRRVAHHLK